MAEREWQSTAWCVERQTVTAVFFSRPKHKLIVGRFLFGRGRCCTCRGTHRSAFLASFLPSFFCLLFVLSFIRPAISDRVLSLFSPSLLFQCVVLGTRVHRPLQPGLLRGWRLGESTKSTISSAAAGAARRHDWAGPGIDDAGVAAAHAGQAVLDKFAAGALRAEVNESVSG